MPGDMRRCLVKGMRDVLLIEEGRRASNNHATNIINSNER
jgi:hypothetical protein